jgi:hypothetical protein
MPTRQARRLERAAQTLDRLARGPVAEGLSFHIYFYIYR